MSEFKLADTLQIPISEAKELITKFFVAFPAIKNYLDNLGYFATSNGYIRTFPPYGRIRQFPEWKDIAPIIHRDLNKQVVKVTSNVPGGFKILGNIERGGKNHPFQGSNSDITKCAVVKLRERIIEKNYPVLLINLIHDEILTECDETFAEEWKVEMSEIMSKAGSKVVKSIPMTVDCKVMDYWQK